jgi:hypothetical protein
MSDLFNRDATITAGRVKIPMRAGDGAFLRFAFSVVKTNDRAPNTASLTIYNLNETHRKGLAKGQPLIIEAGYVGGTSVIFSGDITNVDSTKDTVDWVTTVESGDGATGLSSGRLNKSYSPNADLRTVIKDLTKSLRLGIGNVDQKMSSVELRKQLTAFAKGVVLSGSAAESLNKVLVSAGFQWSVQDGKLQILEKDGATIETVVVLNAASGLIGSPEVGQAKGKQMAVVSFKSLLQGGIKPGRRVKIESLTAKGLFRAEKVTHSGDTHGQNWYTDGEATAV